MDFVSDSVHGGEFRPDSCVPIHLGTPVGIVSVHNIQIFVKHPNG